MLATVKKAGLHVKAVEVTADAIKITVGETDDQPQDGKQEKGEWD